MSRPSTRKEWLETFLWLADRNRPAREFRNKLGVRIPDLKKHISAINSYRNELNALYVKEKTDKRKLQNRVKSNHKKKSKKTNLPEKTPLWLSETPSKKKKDNIDESAKDKSEDVTECNSETLGPREDNIEE